MRKVQIVRRPVVLSLGPHPKAKGTPPDPVPAFKADSHDDLDGQTVLDADDPIDVQVRATASNEFDAVEVDDDLEDEPTIVTSSVPAISTPRTSTSTVSASKRLEVIKESRRK